MNHLSCCALLLAFVLPILGRSAGAKAPSGAEANIRAVLSTQVDAWNRGDIPTFVTTYAEDCIFVGKHLSQGRAQLLEHYRKTYPSRDAMGHLTFSSVAVHLLDAEVAMVTAEWHLERSVEGGGPTGGVFSLVVHRHASEWKIALDHTSKD